MIVLARLRLAHAVFFATLFIIGPISAPWAFAQTVRTEAEVLAAVRGQNLELQAANTRAAAEAERPEQVRWPFPMVQAMVMPQMLAMGEGGLAVMASQTIPRAGQLQADRDARRAAANAALFEVGTLEREYVQRARVAYAELWGIQERQALIDSFRVQLAFYRESALAQYRTNRGPQQAAINLQVEAEALHQRLDLLSERALAFRREIAVLTGGQVLIEPSDLLSRPRAGGAAHAEISPEQLDSHPMVQAGEAMREADEAMVRMNRTMLRPEFSVGATVTLSTPAFRGRYGQEVIVPSVGVMVPLWRDGIRAEIREAEARALQRGLEVEQRRVLLAAEHRDARAQLERVRARIVRFESELLPLVRMAAESTLIGYRTGSLRFIELLDSQRMALDLELELIEARVSEVALSARLEAVTGTPQ